MVGMIQLEVISLRLLFYSLLSPCDI